MMLYTYPDVAKQGGHAYETSEANGASETSGARLKTPVGPTPLLTILHLLC